MTIHQTNSKKSCLAKWDLN